MTKNISAVSINGLRGSELMASFVVTTRTALEKLIQDHGYSRKRAVTTLLQEIAVSAPCPSDQEIFKFMRVHNLGMEQAASAITVAHAVLRATSKSASVEDALKELTVRMAKVQTKVKPTPNVVTTEAAASQTSSPLSVRIVPVHVQQQTPTAIKQPSDASSITTSRSKAVTKKLKTSSGTKNTTASKQVKEPQQPTNRARVDSVTSKLTAAAAAAETSSSKANTNGGKPPAGGNAAARGITNASKRSRSAAAADEAEQQQHRPSSPAAASSGGSKRPRRTASVNSSSVSGSNKVE